MKGTIREHIQQLDVRLGGGIISDRIRVDTIANPMLVIGIGGTGIDALLSLKYQVNRRFKLPEDRVTKKKSDKPENIEFLGIETNQQESDKKYRGIGLDPINEFILLSNPEIGGILQNRSTLDSCITDWLSPELSITDGINGAGGVRQAGRLLLFTKIIQVVKSIEKKINVLLEGTNEKLVVFIMSGLSGGTGSGCFLDIAYIVRGIMEKRFGSGGVDRVNILGYLFTPDVNMAKQGLNSHTEEYIRKNGYAALKELDYWMNVAERGERFRQRYRDVLEVNSPMPPFNLCHLISATNTEGKLLENSYDYCMNVTAENITNFMASEERQSGHEFAIHDYISNIDTNIKQMSHPYSANYKYNIIGASSAVLPVEEITTYMAYRLFKKIEKMFQSEPKQEDIDDFVRQMRVDKDAITKKFQEYVPEPIPGYENSDRLNYHNVIKTQSVSIDSELDSYLTKAREEYIKMRKQYPGELMAELREQIRRVFLNPEKGPIYASRLINSNGGFCLTKTLEATKSALQESCRRFQGEIDSCKNTAAERFSEARKTMINKEKKKNDYIEAKINEFYVKADEERTRYMIEFYEDLISLLNEENTRIYNVFTEILNALNGIFERNGNILVTGQEIESAGTKTYYWNVVNIPDILVTIDQIMENEDSDELIRKFTNELLEDSQHWIKENDIDIVGSISEFMSDRFGDLITKSMEEFLTIKYGEGELIDRLVERNIAKKLDDDAVPVFYLSGSDGSMDYPSWGFVSVPVNTPSILAGIKAYQSNALGRTTFTIKESEVKNRIFWLNTRNGVPLYAYTPLKVYEEVYEKTILGKEGIGRHLVQTPENNWTWLPSPIPQKSWGGYTNQRVRSYNEEVAQLFERAMKQGCIREKASDNNANNRFECIITRAFDIDTLLSKYKLKSDSGQPNFTELKRAIQELRGLLENGIEADYKRDIFESFSRERSIENFVRMPELIKLMRKELDKYDKISSKLEEFTGLIKVFEREDMVFDQFLEALYTGTICKRGTLYVYDREEEDAEWEPFVNLLKVKKYPEYEIFSRFCALDEKKKGYITRKAGKRSEAMGASEDLTPLLDKLNGFIETFRENRDTLEYGKDELTNGEELYSFYKKAFTKLNEIKKGIQ